MLIFLFYSIVGTIRDDFMKKKDQEKGILMLEIQQCMRDYEENRCDPKTRVPQLEGYCLSKEKCMAQDPAMVVKVSKMTAALVAEILNEFVDPLGIKTMAFIFILLFG